jgi:gas vesicle protein
MRLGKNEGKYEASDAVSTAGTAIVFLLIGLGAGALLGMMYAPKTGKQMRKDLRRKYDGARETLEDWTEQAKEVAEEAIERGTEMAEDLRDRVTPLAKNIRRG